MPGAYCQLTCPLTCPNLPQRVLITAAAVDGHGCVGCAAAAIAAACRRVLRRSTGAVRTHGTIVKGTTPSIPFAHTNVGPNASALSCEAMRFAGLS